MASEEPSNRDGDPADAKPPGAPKHVRRRSSRGQLFREAARREAAARHRDEQRLIWAFLLSLSLHFLLLLLQFDSPGIGLPGITHPSKERRVLVPELTVVLVPRQERAASAAGARDGETPSPTVAMTSTGPDRGERSPPPTRTLAPTSDVATTAAPTPATPVPAPPPVRSEVMTAPVPPKAAAQRAARPAPSAEPARTPPPSLQRPAPLPLPAERPVMAVDDRSQDPIRLSKAEVPAAPASEASSAPSTSGDALDDSAARAREAARIQDAHRQFEAEQQLALAQAETRRQEAARLESERQEAARKDAERQEAARKEAERQESARKDAERQEAARKDAERQEAARKEAELQAAARKEAERQEAARKEAELQAAARKEAERQEAARKDAERQEAARKDAERQEAQRRQLRAQQEAARDQAERAAAQRKQAAADHDAGTPSGAVAPPAKEPARGGSSEAVAGAGAETTRTAASSPTPEVVARIPAAQANAPTASPPPAPRPIAGAAKPPAANSQRRHTLIGRTDRDVNLVMYAEGWRQRVEMNAAFDVIKKAKSGAYVDPIVTVALRSDGTVESVTFNRSSGLPELDAAVKTIVQQLSPYDEFPPDVARDYDVVEIRRLWTLDAAVRLFAGHP